MVDKDFAQLEKDGYFLNLDKRSKEFRDYKEWKETPNPDAILWSEVEQRITHKISRQDFKIVCELHAKYFNHKYNEICTCNKKLLRKWIEELSKKLT